jgi:hypothetical protein
MKRALLLGAVLVGATLVPSVTQASPLINTGDVITVISQSSTVHGGEFGIDGPDLNTAADFFTFCIEMDEVVSAVTPNNSYYVKIETFADAGGLDDDNVNLVADPPGPDTLGGYAAFLYSRYAAGLLDDFTNYDGSQNAKDALQVALWTLEDEAIRASDGSYRKRNVSLTFNNAPTVLINPATLITNNAAIVTLADELIAAAHANAQANNIYNVRVMQLWQNADFTGYKQDMLITVPEGASTFGVLMFGVGAVIASRFRFRRSV